MMTCQHMLAVCCCAYLCNICKRSTYLCKWRVHYITLLSKLRLRNVSTNNTGKQLKTTAGRQTR
ncbi:hypothetical protein PF005_g21036 [Phytophthora fragariae]|uniref:Uncharacterized protein n=1 Tax=Phytophthora fragariae TaxID=53985 RepID=A0A6A3J4W9_9STRA|nr:hypothetical protein PF003_g21480 [Phytophthora fragariae]KAE8939916.1 hypothetical protein PF009_g10253 [Phytophthora fragariae]KAE8986503.1 hypothetical protein PF011_g19956 [Phytophthora fragariae]KAE9073045.1 hypothetical protein PF007_g25955 [Phytophthora fragariae]KAE9116073.1 hypothetical protein PF006_g19126 [Phytophthora fragariae]